jgi:hypothetical protein
MMPKIAEGGANKLWIVPSEIGKALEGLGSTMTSLQGIPQQVDGPKTRVDMGAAESLPSVAAISAASDSELSKTSAAVEAAIAEASQAADTTRSTTPAAPASPEGPPAS